MLDLMQQELDFSRGEALTLASLTVDLIRRPAFTYRSSSVPGKPHYRQSGRRPKAIGSSCRGRDADYSTPPAQIRTCGFDAYGSYCGCMAAKAEI